MRPYSSDIDPLAIVIAWGVANMAALAYVFCAPQKLITPTKRAAVGIVVRASLLAAMWLAVCWLLNAPAWTPLAVIGIASVVAGVGAIVLGPTGAISSPVELLMSPLGVATITFFVGADFILGFPGFRKLFSLQKDRATNTTNHATDPMPCYLGRTATVVTPLKPSGEIALGDQRYRAVSETGEYVDAGERVSVSSVMNEMLYVTRMASDS